MEHETENVDNTDLIRQIYQLTHSVKIENNPDLQLKLEELYKIAELRGLL